MSNPVTRTRQGLTRRTVLTNAQVLALPTAPTEVVPAPGIGRVIIPVLASFQLVWVANYTNIDATALILIQTTLFADVILSPGIQAAPFVGVSSLLASGLPDAIVIANIFQAIDGANNLVSWSVGHFASNMDNQALELSCINGASGNFTGGDPGNRLIVTVFYNVVHLG